MKHLMFLLSLLAPSLLVAAPINIAENCNEWIEARQQNTLVE